MRRLILDIFVVLAVLALVTVFVINLGKWGVIKDFASDVFGEPVAEALDGWGEGSQEAVDDAIEFGEKVKSGDFEVDWSGLENAIDKFKPVIPQRKPDYERDEFGSGWLDTDDNGCDARNDILQRDLVETVIDSDNCTVLSGTLHDTFTGETIDFVRGAGTSSDVQIDHMVPLSLAWELGAWEWSDEQREAFANDPENLTAVDGPANGSKSDSPISEWTPPNEAYLCEYTARYVSIHEKYELAMADADREYASEVVAACG